MKCRQFANVAVYWYQRQKVKQFSKYKEIRLDNIHRQVNLSTYEPRHEVSNNVVHVCTTSKCSDQPARTRSLIRAFASRYRDQPYYSHDPEGYVKTRVWQARVLTRPRGHADVRVSENHICMMSRFWKACSRAKTCVIQTSLNYVYVHFYACYCWWRQFLWWPRMRIEQNM